MKSGAGPAERPAGIVVTCEHGGNRIPAAYRRCFTSRSARRALASHRGYDFGALAVARMLARRLGAPLVFTRVSRLLVDQNRSAHNRRVFSEFTAKLSVPERARLLQRYHTEHRRSVEQAVEASLREARRVVHVAVHSFAPRLAGRVRRADVGLLYDPSRVAERAFCTRWQEALRELAPTLRVRRNYPYRGDDDGLTRHLRACHDARRYLGIELELNQALLGGDAAAVARTVSTSLEKLIETV